MLRMLLVVIVMTMVVVVTVRHLETVGRAPAGVATAKPDQTPGVANSRAMVIRAGSDGHFEVDARVEGRRVAFLVDTGATQITLRASEAARLGFRPTPRDYSIRMMTANGEGRAARVDLNMVEVGHIMVRNVLALVTPDEMLPVNLLGMSFLSRVRWSHERGNLILEQ